MGKEEAADIHLESLDGVEQNRRSVFGQVLYCLLLCAAFLSRSTDLHLIHKAKILKRELAEK